MGPERVIRLERGQTALFGYGSLLSIPSLESTLGREYTGPFVPSRLTGWRRTWDAALPNTTFYTETPEGRLYPRSILYLNVRRQRGSVMNGMVFVVNPTELAAYDKREWVYERADVTADLDVRVEGGHAFTYVCRPEYRRSSVRLRTEAAVLATYVDVVQNGLAQLGAQFREEYDRSSDPVPQHLVIGDRIERP